MSALQDVEAWRGARDGRLELRMNRRGRLGQHHWPESADSLFRVDEVQFSVEGLGERACELRERAKGCGWRGTTVTDGPRDRLQRANCAADHQRLGGQQRGQVEITAAFERQLHESPGLPR